jgi:hypothetical protein
MVATLASMGRPKKSEPSKPFRVPESFLKRVKRIATHRDIDPGDYVAERMAELLDQDEKAMLTDIEKERKKK